ncbi:hypothetical protein [Kitasatospora sp. CB02891]|uniref:hypothetical protein n=1 Tax=Kitasatospora sp. CB02891 TaxID=2020329 RepID=UPI000C27EEFF|nr:hypothetical protein [Kitasatospora sp. CB02891]PJN26243.1 hypothetical protein CG736_12755 [Kitasatospora sp. CB02891]
MTGTALVRLAAGDFRDRVRRPVYAVTLLAAVALGRLAVPAADSRWAIIDVGGNRGVYNSAWVGTATALAGALWLTVGGFWVVRGGIVRDAAGRVGEILAATPLRTAGYLAAKFLANLLVLASMLGVLAGTALVLQLVRGEDRAVHPLALFGPFVLIALPLIAVTAAAAVLFDTVPPLRAGFGNVVWFVLSLALAIGGQSADAPLGGIGVQQATQSMVDALRRQQLPFGDGEFSLGLTQVPEPLHTFGWDGAQFSGGFLATRLAIVACAAALAVLPALWFGRFDPARNPGRTATATATARSVAEPAEPVAPAAPGPFEPFGALPPTAPVRAGTAFGRLLVGQTRILVQGVPWTWWAVTAALGAAALAVPLPLVTGLLLPALWLWPVLIWSRLGSQQVENGLEELLAAHPAPRLRLLADWASGVLLAAVAGLGPLLRMLVAGDAAGAAHWLAGALFVPALALGLGTAVRSHRPFQALYLPLWYLLVNQVRAVDFMGAVRTAGRPDGPSPLLVAALAAALLGAAVLAGAARRDVKR